MSVSIVVVDDEPDVAEMFPHRFCRSSRTRRNQAAVVRSRRQRTKPVDFDRLKARLA